MCGSCRLFCVSHIMNGMGRVCVCVCVYVSESLEKRAASFDICFGHHNVHITSCMCAYLCGWTASSEHQWEIFGCIDWSYQQWWWQHDYNIRQNTCGIHHSAFNRHRYTYMPANRIESNLIATHTTEMWKFSFFFSNLSWYYVRCVWASERIKCSLHRCRFYEAQMNWRLLEDQSMPTAYNSAETLRFSNVSWNFN